MPFPPFFAAGAVAAVVGATHDCEYDDALEETGGKKDEGDDNIIVDDSVVVEEADTLNRKNVRFQNDAPTSSSSLLASENSAPKSLRSIESDNRSLSSSGGRNGPPIPGQVQLGATSRSLMDNDEDDTTQSAATPVGFVQGYFMSAKIKDLTVERCHTMAHAPGMDLLAVGGPKELTFYETRQYQAVHRVACKGMVSAISWTLTPTSSNPLLAVSGLDGSVSLYTVDPDILESQGPTLLYEVDLKQEVRALDLVIMGQRLSPTVLMVVGTKTPQNGTLTAISLALADYSVLDRSIWKHFSGGILSLSVSVSTNWLAVSTSGGQAAVYSIRRDGIGAAVLADVQAIWSTTRNGPIRSIVFEPSSASTSPQLALGGYDKTVVLVDTALWAISRQISLKGTVNVISFDPRGRYLCVGCRDRSLSLYDTSTFVSIKTFHTTGWVTSISWMSSKSESDRDVVAIRADKDCISILDLSTIQLLETTLSSRHGKESSLSWSRDGRFVARARGSFVVVADAWDNFRDVSSGQVDGKVVNVAFSQNLSRRDCIAVVSDSGCLTLLSLSVHGWSRLQGKDERESSLTRTGMVRVCSDELKALAWSPDSSLLAVGGKNKFLYVFRYDNLKHQVEPIELHGRIWDISFVPTDVQIAEKDRDQVPFVAIALGDYTALLLDDAFQPCLKILRSRTVRCVAFHPNQPLLAIGDGAETLAVVDYQSEDMVHEAKLGGRVNHLEYSPIGDFLIAATDGCFFSLHETTHYKSVQEVPSTGFALSASFSSNGLFLAMGCENESYAMLRLGPMLGIDLIPLEKGLNELPSWAVREAIHRSGNGPSFLQRQMAQRGSEGLRRVAYLLQEYPEAVYTFDRESNEGCFDTALMLKKPNLLKLAVTSLVDGSLEGSGDNQRSLLTTDIPYRGRDVLFDIVENYPPDFAVEIFNQVTFMKVPYTSPRLVPKGDRLVCGSRSYTDPWDKGTLDDKEDVLQESFQSFRVDPNGGVVRTAALLPLPGLGEMNFLISLLSNSPASVFNNEALALVLRVMWEDYIRPYFFVDFAVFVIFYMCWVYLVELTTSEDRTIDIKENSIERIVAILTAFLNSLFAGKELIQSRFGRRDAYWRSLWNIFDINSILFVYIYVAAVLVPGFKRDALVPLAVVSTLMQTVMLLSYLRGFGQTGWLISVLSANFRDVRGFLIILLVILIGFSVSFRLLFRSVGDETYGSLRRSLLSTFEMTVTGNYDVGVMFEADQTILSLFTFVLAITTVLVVALNALISVLSDSYARIQEDSVANRRREQASLIVEYMSLLPPWKRRKIEADTKWFHSLLEVDADGDLLIQNDDWQGGLNALRQDIEEISENNHNVQQKALDQLRADIDAELSSFRKEVKSILEDLSDDIKSIRKNQSRGSVSFSGKNVAKAVRAVQTVGRQGRQMLQGSDT